MSGWVWTLKPDTPLQDSLYEKKLVFNKSQPYENTELQKEIETPVLLAHAIEDSTDIFGISGGGVSTPPQTPPRYATGCVSVICQVWILRIGVLYFRRLPEIDENLQN